MFEVKGLPMKDAAHHKDVHISSEDCRDAIRMLIAKYGWSLPSENELSVTKIRGMASSCHLENLCFW